MRERTVRILLLILVGAIVITTAVFMLDDPTPDTTLGEPMAAFMGCLPNDLTDAEVEEVEGLLIRYTRLVMDGNVAIDRQMDIRDRVQAYVDAGYIDKADLYTLMARVSTYMYEHEQDIHHPLYEEDSTATGEG